MSRTHRSSRSRRRKRTEPKALAGRIALGAVGVFVLGALGVVGWAGLRSAQALPHIERAQQIASSLDVGTLLAGDTSDVDELQNELREAKELTSGVGWSLAEGLPWIGPQLSAVSTMSSALDELGSGTLGSLAELTDGGLGDLLPEGGRIDTGAITAMQDPLARAGRSLDSARSQINSVDRSTLVGPLSDGWRQVGGLLDEIEPLLDGVTLTTEVLPGFLGADGPRDHLIMLQNTAEWRTLGGIAGSLIQMRVDGGAIALDEQVAASDMHPYDAPIADLNRETEAIYGDRPGRWIHNTTMAPEFPEAASLARAIWADQSGTEVSGVFSMDPVALSYFLEATGPVQLPTGETLTSENAVALLLNEVYLNYPDPAAQDAFFGVAASAVFDALVGGGMDPVAMITAFQRSIDEGRLLVWSADADEQGKLESTAVAGLLPESGRDATAFGVYMNDSTGSKLSYYIETGSDVRWCGDGTASLTVSMHNTAPGNIADLSDYIVGTREEATVSGVPRGIARTLVTIYLPEGATLEEDEMTNGSLNLVGTYQGRTVYEWWHDLGPDDEATITMKVDTTTGPALSLDMTPVVKTMDVEGGC